MHPKRKPVIRVASTAAQAGQWFVPFSTVIIEPPNPTMLPIDRSNSPTAKENIRPIVAKRMTVWVPKISLTVGHVGNVLGSKIEKSRATATHAKSTP